jgi:hypothetical protein
LQTIKFQLNVRQSPDMNTSISTEHIVENPEAAWEAGQEAARLVNSFLLGFGTVNLLEDQGEADA